MLLDAYVGQYADQLQEQLLKAQGRNAVYEAAVEARTWRFMRNELQRIPRMLEEELKDEGDEVYG